MSEPPAPDPVLDLLIETAEAAGLRVRRTRGRSDPELPLASGICRLRGEWWVVLSDAETQEDHVAVVVEALLRHASDFLEGRFLPPAVRERLERAREPGS